MAMINICISIPELYEKKIKQLIKGKEGASRSGTIRKALGEFLEGEVRLMGFCGGEKHDG